MCCLLVGTSAPLPITLMKSSVDFKTQLDPTQLLQEIHPEYQLPVYVKAILVVFLISVCTFCVVAGTASLRIAGTNKKQQQCYSHFMRVKFMDFY